MVGGSRAFGAGGYERTPIAEILPVEMVAGQQRAARGASSSRSVVDEARAPSDRRARARSRRRTCKAWSELAPLARREPAARAARGRAGAARRIRARTDEQRQADAGAGGGQRRAGPRAGARRPTAPGAGASPRPGARGDASAYERFWDRALRWLARDPLLDPAHIETDRERYGPGGVLQGAHAPARRALPAARRPRARDCVRARHGGRGPAHAAAAERSTRALRPPSCRCPRIRARIGSRCAIPGSTRSSRSRASWWRPAATSSPIRARARS